MPCKASDGRLRGVSPLKDVSYHPDFFTALCGPSQTATDGRVEASTADMTLFHGWQVAICQTFYFHWGSQLTFAGTVYLHTNLVVLEESSYLS